jgi:hypothetical protein
MMHPIALTQRVRALHNRVKSRRGGERSTEASQTTAANRTVDMML